MVLRGSLTYAYTAHVQVDSLSSVYIKLLTQNRVWFTSWIWFQRYYLNFKSLCIHDVYLLRDIIKIWRAELCQCNLERERAICNCVLHPQGPLVWSSSLRNLNSGPPVHTFQESRNSHKSIWLYLSSELNWIQEGLLVHMLATSNTLRSSFGTREQSNVSQKEIVMSGIRIIQHYDVCYYYFKNSLPPYPFINVYYSRPFGQTNFLRISHSH